MSKGELWATDGRAPGGRVEGREAGHGFGGVGEWAPMPQRDTPFGEVCPYEKRRRVRVLLQGRIPSAPIVHGGLVSKTLLDPDADACTSHTLGFGAGQCSTSAEIEWRG